MLVSSRFSSFEVAPACPSLFKHVPAGSTSFLALACPRMNYIKEISPLQYFCKLMKKSKIQKSFLFWNTSKTHLLTVSLSLRIDINRSTVVLRTLPNMQDGALRLKRWLLLRKTLSYMFQKVLNMSLTSFSSYSWRFVAPSWGHSSKTLNEGLKSV